MLLRSRKLNIAALGKSSKLKLNYKKYIPQMLNQNQFHHHRLIDSYLDVIAFWCKRKADQKADIANIEIQHAFAMHEPHL